MKVLVVGGGGREHAIIKKLHDSSNVDKIYCAPGNGGISKLAECFGVSATDIEGQVALAKKLNPDMVVVAPDDPLCLGLVDELEKEGIRAFGPKKDAAIIEGSKVFSKNLMKKYNIPTAAYEVFEDQDKAIEYLKTQSMPIVIKAEGLALGKGVIIAQTLDEAVDAVKSMMSDKKFGTAGDRIVIEEFMSGVEATVLAFTDGTTVYPMVSSKDHKRAYDNDEGLNTGGMGTISPNPAYTDAVNERAMNEIFIPTVKAMNAEGRKFKGCIYFGLMITDKGPKVVEYNARFGDPEAQVVLPRLETDIYEIFDAIIDERLADLEITWTKRECACVVMASGGYPVSYEKGFEISGIDAAEENKDVFVFHAGTSLKDGKFVTSGGRVLGVTAMGDTLSDALKTAYEAVDKINFKDAHYRKDIGVIR